LDTGKYGFEAGVVSAAKEADEASFAVQRLSPEPEGAQYDPELERLCRIAASVGAERRRSAPLSFTALVIAFLFAEDKVSRWFQNYVGSRKINQAEIFASKRVGPNTRHLHLKRADSGELPVATPLYSVSVKYVLREAANIAREFSHRLLTPGHVMAAYAFRTPSDHRDQVRGWGFDERDWQPAVLAALQEFYPETSWERLRTSVRAAPRLGPLVGRYTADDPTAPPRDLIGVEDEAAAFARILAASAIKPPLAVGVFGEWGSGKTFFMRRIFENVEQLTQRAAKDPKRGPFYPDIVQIRFNAWHYIETNLWASLVEYIFTELDRWLLQKSDNERARADLVFDRLATAQQLKLDALEDVVSRRAERRSAELRAERARREYEEALARAVAVGPSAYGRAMLAHFLQQDPQRNQELEEIGNALGIRKAQESAAQVSEVLEQARSEAGRARLVMQSGIAKLGTVPWILSVILVLLGFPIVAAALKQFAGDLLNLQSVKSIHDAVAAVGGLTAGVAALAGMLVRQASAVLGKIDNFDRALQQEIERQTVTLDRTDLAKRKVEAEAELKKRKQAMESAERALADADARLAAARQDFESATARSRLNAFIRAKATDGDYAKHLGIIAAIRRDFGQLATLMGAVNDAREEREEHQRLATQAKARVGRFLKWLTSTEDVQLTASEVRSLFSLLEVEDAIELFEGASDQLQQHLEGTSKELNAVLEQLREAQSSPPPKFSRIILYIDDLDRCPKEIVVAVLQAVHLLLSFPLFIVVVAVDARWVSRALREQFPKLLSETGMFADGANGNAAVGAGASSHDYLEKIFQIPYWVRPIEAGIARRYVMSIAAEDMRAPIESGDGSQRREPAGPGEPIETTQAPQQAAPITRQSDGQSDKTQRASTEEREELATSLTLTDWEVQTLELFASFVGSTPRRLIRFVNVYRLIKTSLPVAMRDQLVGEHGESEDYRALICQLSIVTGAPHVAAPYFSVLETLKPEESLSRLVKALKENKLVMESTDSHVLLDVLQALDSVDDSAEADNVRIEHLQRFATIASRYSFTARPH
jgi:hypothetical protein